MGDLREKLLEQDGDKRFPFQQLHKNNNIHQPHENIFLPESQERRRTEGGSSDDDDDDDGIFIGLKALLIGCSILQSPRALS